MPTFKKCPQEIHGIANNILTQFESHKLLLDCRARVDLVFAYADRDDETNEKLNDAIKHQGVKALGVARILGLKDRAMGRGDAEIVLDGDWWSETASEEQQRAVLDHELHHLAPKLTKGQFTHDALGRPKLKMRKHDVQFGWFAVIAERHGKNSIEQMQAESLMDTLGQYFWPLLAPTQPAKQVSDAKKKK